MSSYILDNARALVTALTAEAKAIEALAEGLQVRRKAFVSSRADDLQQAVDDLESLAVHVTELEQRRGELTRRLGNALGLGRDPRIKDFVRALPPGLVPELSDTADRARRAARSLRLESSIGGDLLAASARAHESIVRGLVEAQGKGPGLYDRRSRVHQVDTEARTGRLVDGRV